MLPWSATISLVVVKSTGVGDSEALGEIIKKAF